MRIRSVLSAVLLLGAVAVVTACSGGNRITHSSAEEAYQKAMDLYAEEDYEKALRYFRAVFQYGRGNEWADDAQFHLATTYREQGKYLLAANEFERFTKLYRNNQRVPQAEFQRALMYYNLSPHYKLDQSDSRRAISYFQVYMERHPRHEFVPQAREHINELRNKLAHKNYDAAQLYERREMWDAATETYENVFETYPDTDWADNALLGAIRSYIEYADRSIRARQDERYQSAIDHYNRLAQVFPDSDLLNRAEGFYSEAQRKLDALRAEEDQQSIAQDGGQTRSP